MKRHILLRKTVFFYGGIDYQGLSEKDRFSFLEGEALFKKKNRERRAYVLVEQRPRERKLSSEWVLSFVFFIRWRSCLWRKGEEQKGLAPKLKAVLFRAKLFPCE
jgi:hypothetical protein